MEVKQIIDKFKDDFEYVKDTDALISYLIAKKVPISKLNKIMFEVLEWNNTTEERLRRKLNNQKPKGDNDHISEQVQPEPQKPPSQQDKIPSVSEYITQLTMCDSTDFITDILPSKYDSNYNEIIVAILLKLYGDISSGCALLKELESSSEKEYLEGELNKAREIVKAINEYKDEDEMEESQITEEKPQNNIIYLSSGETPYIFSDIDNMNIEDYQFVSSLLESLMCNKIFHEKRFVSFEDLKGISAIRKGDCRVVFTRLGSNTVVVLGVIAKRFQNMSSYGEFLRRRAKTFKEKKQEYRALSSSERFIVDNLAITEQITKKLNANDTKSLRKKRYADGENI